MFKCQCKETQRMSQRDDTKRTHWHTKCTTLRLGWKAICVVYTGTINRCSCICFVSLVTSPGSKHPQQTTVSTPINLDGEHYRQDIVSSSSVKGDVNGFGFTQLLLRTREEIHRGWRLSASRKKHASRNPCTCSRDSLAQSTKLQVYIFQDNKTWRPLMLNDHKTLTPATNDPSQLLYFSPAWKDLQPWFCDKSVMRHHWEQRHWIPMVTPLMTKQLVSEQSEE